MVQQPEWVPQPAVQRLRITFAKGEEIRFIAHLDLQRTWERTLRRARAPLAYTGGFNPHPRLNFAAPLAVGAMGEQELLDVWLRERRDPAALLEALQQQSPRGLRVLAIHEVPMEAPPLQALVRAAVYRAELWNDERLSRQEIEERIHALLARERIPRRRERAGKSAQEYDLRPHILELGVREWDDAAGRWWLHMRLRAGSEATGRPQDVLAELGVEARLIVRERVELAA